MKAGSRVMPLGMEILMAKGPTVLLLSSGATRDFIYLFSIWGGACIGCSKISRKNIETCTGKIGLQSLW